MKVFKPKIIVITGPTATGKSAVGALFAKTVDGEVVSADSMQVYEHMDIGTAKPTMEEMLGIRHHMLDIVPPWEDYSVARYVADAACCIDGIIDRGKLPVLVGGSGLYIDSLLSGREFSARGDDALRRELELEYDELGGKVMLHMLKELDPETAERLHVNDKKRIVRAIEVFKVSGKNISLHNRETRLLDPRYDADKYALTFSDRAVLYKRIERRVDMMMSNGLEQEVQALLDMGVAPDATAMQAIGYKEIVGAIQGQFSLGDAVEKIKMESRRYAKRQLTWLRRDNNIRWITWDESPEIERGATEIFKR